MDGNYRLGAVYLLGEGSVMTTNTSTRTRRHPAEVTADRLRDHLDKDWDAAHDAGVLDEISRLIDWLERIASEAEAER